MLSYVCEIINTIEVSVNEKGLPYTASASHPLADEHQEQCANMRYTTCFLRFHPRYITCFLRFYYQNTTCFLQNSVKLA